MLIFTNILIVAFILAMAYWMSIQGFFSAFLHLVIVLIAGSLALAFWEPLVFSLGMKMQPQYANGLWLLGPFILLLIGLRLLMDRVVRKNVNFQNLFNLLLGGACGAAAGAITAGIVLIGLGFLPLPQSLAGIDPYVVAGGQVQETGQDLWIPVDQVAADVFNTLAGGAFATRTPLPVYQPNLARQASMHRIGKGYDPHASIMAAPGSVEVTAVHSQATPTEQLSPQVALSLGAGFKDSRNKLVVVDTRWEDRNDGTYDTDNGLRLPPTQIRLFARANAPGTRGGEIVGHAPVGYSHQQADGRVYQPFNAANIVAFGNRQTERFGWVFLIPATHEPLFLFARHLRLELPEPTGDGQAIAAALGQMAGGDSDTATASNGAGAGDTESDGSTASTSSQPSELGPREGIRTGSIGVSIENTNRLPGHELSTNFVQGLNMVGSSVLEGKATGARRPASISRNTVIDSIYVAGHQGAIRLKIAQDRAQSLLGQARTAAASLQGVWITDARGDVYQPIGYVWLKSGGEQEISIDRNNPIRSARQLPVPQMGSNDELYLYFAVPKGARIVSYNVGDSTRQAVQPPLVAN